MFIFPWLYNFGLKQSLIKCCKLEGCHRMFIKMNVLIYIMPLFESLIIFRRYHRSLKCYLISHYFSAYSVLNLDTFARNHVTKTTFNGKIPDLCRPMYHIFNDCIFRNYIYDWFLTFANISIKCLFLVDVFVFLEGYSSRLVN